jgi:flagellar basal-body rod modification protein FlgD
MSSIPSTSTTIPSTDATSSTNSAALNAAFANLGPSDFLQMMMAELQNQDPLDPTNTDDMLSELSTMTQVASNETMATTLNSIGLGQNLADAGALIGATVSGLSNQNSQQIVGNVDSVTITGGTPVLNIGSDTMNLSNIEAIYPPGSSVNSGTSSTPSSQ